MVCPLLPLRAIKREGGGSWFVGLMMGALEGVPNEAGNGSAIQQILWGRLSHGERFLEESRYKILALELE